MHTLEPLASDAPRAGGLRSLLKLVVVGASVLVLLIPVAQILALVRERRQRQEEVRREIAGNWAASQTVGALLLEVPYRAAGALPGAPRVGTVSFLPASLRWTGSLQPETRQRGLFAVTVYEARLEAGGWFAAPDPSALGVLPSQLDWSSARALIGMTDPRGLQERAVLRWGGQPLAFVPADVSPLGPALQASVGGRPRGERIPFALSLRLRGMESLRLMPLGDDTNVELASPWPHPSFVGAPSPATHRIGPGGFAAGWSVPYYGRRVPQLWRNGQIADGQLGAGLSSAAFGVELVRPADPYQQTERAVKYAVLFILLTFTTVFVLELLSPVRLHAMSYLLVGAALCLFYLLLLALAEHVGLATAYAIATAAIVGLVTLYAGAVLAGAGRALAIGGVLTALYAWLYVVLQAEEYALLLGAGGLFAALAAVMYLTRRLDWSTLRFRPAPAG